MKVLIFLVHIWALIDFAMGHSIITEPPTRQSIRTIWSGGFMYQYFMRGGDVNVCGDQQEATGPVVRTYTSGQSFDARIRVSAGHGGFYRMKLCQLKNSTDVATENCLNQNLLKIKPTSFKSDDDPKFYDGSLIMIDDYSFRQPTTLTSNNININFTVQLPAGLTCNNCVLQWIWYQIPPTAWSDYTCKFLSNGTNIQPNQTVSGLENYPCKFINWRTCTDIQILPNFNSINTAYKPNPLEQRSFPQTFQCFRSADEQRDFSYGVQKSAVINWKVPYPAKFQPGAQLFCIINSTAPPNSCEVCRQNCGSPDKICPDVCFCSWSSIGQVSYLKMNEDFNIKIGPAPWNLNNMTSACDFSDGFQVISSDFMLSGDCAKKCQTTTNCTHYVWYFSYDQFDIGGTGSVELKNPIGRCNLIWGKPLKSVWNSTLPFSQNFGSVTPSLQFPYNKCGIISKNFRK